MADYDIINVLKQGGFLRPDAVLTPEDETALRRLTPDDVQALLTIRDHLGLEFWNRHLPPKVDLIF